MLKTSDPTFKAHPPIHTPASRAQRRLEAGYETGSSDDSLHPPSGQGTLHRLPHRQVEREPFADPALYAVPLPASAVPDTRQRFADRVGRLVRRPARPLQPIRLVRFDLQTVPTGPYLRRPQAAAFQHYNELVDHLHRAPAEDFPRLSRALAQRLQRADLVLPPARHSSAGAMRFLMTSDWHHAAVEGRLNVTELLSVMSEPRAAAFLSPDMRRRIAAALGAAVAHIARHHPGVERLRVDALRPLRPLPSADQREAAQSSPRMQAFLSHARRMLALPEVFDATAGQLAVGLHHCLVHGRKIEDNEAACVIGQIRPAIESLIQLGDVSMRLNERLRTAADRLDLVLQLQAGLDLDEREPAKSAATDDNLMAQYQARKFLLARLMTAALNPAELNGLIQERRLTELLHPVLFGCRRSTESANESIHMLRLTLRPMVDSGLMSNDQRHALMGMVKRALRTDPHRSAPKAPGLPPRTRSATAT